MPHTDRKAHNGHKAGILWLTSVFGSGKSTVARELETRLFDRGWQTMLLDVDTVRHILDQDLEFTAETEPRIFVASRKWSGFSSSSASIPSARSSPRASETGCGCVPFSPRPPSWRFTSTALDVKRAVRFGLTECPTGDATASRSLPSPISF